MAKSAITSRVKALTIGKEFATKANAINYINGTSIGNTMHVGDTNGKYNIIFLQHGKASYKRDGVEVETGYNRIYTDRIETLGNGSLKPALIDPKKHYLVFTTNDHKHRKDLRYYRYHGEFKLSSLQSIGADELNYAVYIKA